jgi:Domain of unknown function (DUF4136)
MRKLSTMAMAVALAGCMGGLDVVIEKDEPLGAAKTFFVIPGLDEAKAGRSNRLVSDFVYGRLDAVVARTLTERGYDRVLDAQRADLVVRYAVFAREWITMRSVPPPPLSQPPPGWDRLYDGAYNGSYSELEVEDHREGSMVVDVVDVDGGKLIYRFFVEGALGGSAKDNVERVEKAVAEGFKRLGKAR